MSNSHGTPSSDGREAAAALAGRIGEIARTAHSEEDLRLGFEHALRDTLSVLGLHSAPQYEKTTFSGSADAVYGNVVIEYKRPRRLKLAGEPTRLRDQLARYLRDLAKKAAGEAGLEEALSKLVGIGTDGEQISFIRYSRMKSRTAAPFPMLPGAQSSFSKLEDGPGGFEMLGPVPISEESVNLLLLYLRSLSRRPLTAEGLADEFGPSGEIAPALVSTLYHALVDNRSNNSRVETFFEEWDRIFGIVYGAAVGTAASEAPELAALYRMVQSDRETDLKPLLFAVHTYYALLMKLLAVELASLQEGAMVQSFVPAIVGLEPMSLREKLAELEDGGTFALLGIKNFLEGDFFGWYLDCWSPDVARAISRLAHSLSEFEPATSSLEPDRTRDLLKELYQFLVPKKLRHHLGEYYTPDWLADRLLNQVGYEGDQAKRVIDPGCGSGTFLVLALRRLRENSAANLVPPADVLTAATRNVVGFDLNPLSVIAARTNYLLALGDLLRHRTGAVELPVYICDSVLTPTERTDLYGNSYRLRTVVGDFEIPCAIVSKGKVAELCELLERCVRGDFAPEDFAALLRRDFPDTSADAEQGIFKLYAMLQDLEHEGRDGIWARLLKNAFAPVLVGHFDFVVGNPPWVNWESLSKDYREATKRIWSECGLFTLSGHAARLGGGKKDLAMLFTYVSADRYLRAGGRLGFVVTQTVFQTGKAGAGFRRFQIGDRSRLRVLHVDDLVEIQPFEGASNWTSVVILQKGAATRYPVPYTLWRKRKGRIGIRSSLEDVSKATTRLNYVASPVQRSDLTSPWIVVRPQLLESLQHMIGRAPFRARAGACTWADGVYWVDILDRRPDGLLMVQNKADAGKRDLKNVRAVVEPDVVFPFVEWKQISRFHFKPTHYILLPQDPERRVGIDEGVMRREMPHTFGYFSNFRDVLRSRSGLKKYFEPERDPFYTIYNVGEYTFAPYRVVWRSMGNAIESVVLGNVDDPNLGSKAPIHKNTVAFVPFEDEDDAHFLCGMLNSSIVTFIARSYAPRGSKSFGGTNLLDYVSVPAFRARDPSHQEIVALSLEAHHRNSPISNNDPILDRIDHAAARVWGLSDDLLARIRSSLLEIS